MSREGRIVAPATADPLDMRQYRIETLPVRAKGPIERRMAQIGIPLAVLLFVVFGFLVDLPFLQQVNMAEWYTLYRAGLCHTVSAEGTIQIRCNHFRR